VPRGAPLTAPATASAPRRRALIAIWLRGAIVIAIVLAIPSIYTAAKPLADATAAQQRGLVWWSRILAAVFAAGLLRRTARLLRRDRGPAIS
jgi:hypothetical protein